MEQIKLSRMKDGAKFLISKKKKVVYTVNTKQKNVVIATADKSGRTFSILKDTLVYPAE